MPSGRKRPLAEEALLRVQSLSATARGNAPDPSYLDRPAPNSAHTPLITTRQREKVVKYINELAEDFELCVQTGGLACNYFDRYVATLCGPSDKRHIQTIASTCLLIAAKFFDRKLPPLSELTKVHHGKVTDNDFAELELEILDRLRWKLHVPLPHAFIEHLLSTCRDAPFSASIEDRTLFFIDLSVYGYHFLAYPPCAIAAASIITAWKFSEQAACVPDHFPALARACGLETRQLDGCVNAMVSYYQQCFPEAAKKGSQAAQFVPIPADLDEKAKRSENVVSPDSIFAALPGSPPSPTPPAAIGGMSLAPALAAGAARAGAVAPPPPPALA